MDIKILIEKARQKDPCALETLYMMYYPKMLGLCIKITKEDEETAKDLVHDAFILAFSSLHSIRTSERFGEWLSTIVRNVALKYIGRKKKISFVSITEKEKTLYDTTSSDMAVNIQDILKLVDELPNGYSKVFRLSVIEGLSHKEIAEILGIEQHSSSSQLSRAKEMLRKMISHRLLLVVLLLMMIIPLYFLFMWKEPLQSTPEITERDSRRKEIDTNETQENHHERTGSQRPGRNNRMISCVVDEAADTMGATGKTVVETVVPDEQMAVQERDSIEKTDTVMPQQPFMGNELAAGDLKRKDNKWQMIAAGSLGPALAQDIYKLIATGVGGDIDSEAPTFPENANTWEDYSRYLHTTVHENTPEDTLALVEIADHNQGDIVEQEHHERPITFGISLSKPISDRWSIETGLQYSILKSRSTTGYNGYYIGKEQKVHYLGIPIRLSYRLTDYKRLSAYGSAGLSLHIPVYGKVNSKYILADTLAYTNSWHVTPPMQWSTHFSLGLQYQILPKMTLYIEPTLYWYIPNGSSTHTIWTERPIMFSAPLGIRFTW